MGPLYTSISFLSVIRETEKYGQGSKYIILTVFPQCSSSRDDKNNKNVWLRTLDILQYRIYTKNAPYFCHHII